MVKLFGKKWNKETLLSYVGDVSALGGIQLSELSDGPGRGIRIADIRSGGGLRFTVLIDRGMDIGFTSFKDIPISFLASSGIRSPYFYGPEGYEWQRNFHGGMLCLCGLSAAGHPSEDDFGGHGLHGRVSNTPAQSVSVGDEWNGDDYSFWITGRVRESWVFGFNLQMTRKISVHLGGKSFFVEDKFENLGSESSPLMLIYHCNFGFPLVSEGSKLCVNDYSIVARDAVAEAGLDKYQHYEMPQKGYKEQVFYHKPIADDDGYVQGVVVNQWLNDGNGLAGYVRYHHEELPELIQWKQMGKIDYAAGVEPSNCYPEGRARELERGTLKMIEPGEVVEAKIEIGVIDERSRIEELLQE